MSLKGVMEAEMLQAEFDHDLFRGSGRPGKMKSAHKDSHHQSRRGM